MTQRSPVVRATRVIDALCGLPGFLLILALRHFMKQRGVDEH